MSVDQVGVIIESGASDWQVFQRDERGLGTIKVAGSWKDEMAEGRVEVRLIHEDSSLSIGEAQDWRFVRTTKDGRWSATIKDIPAGGLYRLETRFRPKGRADGEWCPRGDMRHFLGVGDLWIIAGQSNSAGYGRDPIDDPPELGLHVFRNSEEWALASHPLNDSTDTKHPANREGANPGHSPYLHFARLLKRSRGYPIGLIQTSLGGSGLAVWNPCEPGGAYLYDNMVSCVKKAGGKVTGVLWYQGESDSGEKECSTYKKRFIDAVKAWRKALKHADLPVITVQLNRMYGATDPVSDRWWSNMRDVQRRIVHGLKGVAIVPTIDLQLSDGIHLNAASNMRLGARMADAALGMVHGEPIVWQAPEIQSATKVGKGDEIKLLFSPVVDRMECIDPWAKAWRVEDADGEVSVQQASGKGDTMTLKLQRKLKGKAKVYGGYGINPEMVPMDMARHMPMLGFGNVPVS